MRLARQQAVREKYCCNCCETKGTHKFLSRSCPCPFLLLRRFRPPNRRTSTHDSRFAHARRPKASLLRILRATWGASCGGGGAVLSHADLSVGQKGFHTAHTQQLDNALPATISGASSAAQAGGVALRLLGWPPPPPAAAATAAGGRRRSSRTLHHRLPLSRGPPPTHLLARRLRRLLHMPHRPAPRAHRPRPRCSPPPLPRPASTRRARCRRSLLPIRSALRLHLHLGRLWLGLDLRAGPGC